MSLKDRIPRLLREAADKIDAGNSELSESEAMDIMRVLCREGMSKAIGILILGEHSLTIL